MCSSIMDKWFGMDPPAPPPPPKPLPPAPTFVGSLTEVSAPRDKDQKKAGNETIKKRKRAGNKSGKRALTIAQGSPVVNQPVPVGVGGAMSPSLNY